MTITIDNQKFENEGGREISKDVVIKTTRSPSYYGTRDCKLAMSMKSSADARKPKQIVRSF